MRMTGSTMGDVLSLSREELRLTRAAIGQYHREINSEGSSGGGSLADLAGGGEP